MSATLKSEDFVELLLKMVKVERTVRRLLIERFTQQTHDEPMIGHDGKPSKDIRLTITVGALQMEPLHAADEAFSYLAGRAINANNTLDLEDTLIQQNLKIVFKELEHLKPFFGKGSGYSIASQMEATKAIEDFLQTAGELGLTLQTQSGKQK